MEDQLIETWRISNRTNLYMLAAIPPEALGGVSASKGRNVAKQFAHLHDARLMWLKVAAPELMDTVTKLGKDAELNHDILRRSLEESGQAIEALVRKAVANGGKVKGFKPHVTAFVGYLIAHDGYHRGEIGIILKQSGHPLDDKTSYGLWEWGVR